MFITFEGIDFCGKSTQAERLVHTLGGRSFDVIALRDPGGTKISEQIREILLKNENQQMNAVTELLLYEAARSQIVEE